MFEEFLLRQRTSAANEGETPIGEDMEETNDGNDESDDETADSNREEGSKKDAISNEGGEGEGEEGSGSGDGEGSGDGDGKKEVVDEEQDCPTPTTIRPPNFPTEHHQPRPKKNGGVPGHLLMDDVKLTRWEDQVGAVFSFPCSKSRSVLEPWYQFRVEGNSGKRYADCDNHPQGDVNSATALKNQYRNFLKGVKNFEDKAANAAITGSTPKKSGESSKPKSSKTPKPTKK